EAASSPTVPRCRGGSGARDLRERWLQNVAEAVPEGTASATRGGREEDWNSWPVRRRSSLPGQVCGLLLALRRGQRALLATAAEHAPLQLRKIGCTLLKLRRRVARLKLPGELFCKKGCLCHVCLPV